MGKEITRRLALMTGAAAIAAGWGLPAVAFPRSRPPTSRAKLSQLLVTAFYEAPSSSRSAGPPFNCNCRCAAWPIELPIGVATVHHAMIMDERYTGLRVELRYVKDDIEVHRLAFYDQWSAWLAASPGGSASWIDAQPLPGARRWTWQPTLANTQGLMTLTHPGSHPAVTLMKLAGSMNLIKAESLVGDIDISQIT